MPPETAHAVLPEVLSPPTVWNGGPALAVTVHAIDPRSFQRARDIREWLAAREVDRVTLAVVPAADLHPVGTRAPLLAAWLRARAARGDAIAQHGLHPHGRRSEFSGLAADESCGRVETGLALLREVELDPQGFIAPGYGGYTAALREALSCRFSWFGERGQVRGPGISVDSTALGLGRGTPLSRLLSPVLARRRASLCGDLMRLDIHPADFALPGHAATFEGIIARAAGRQVVTYDDLFCGQSS